MIREQQRLDYDEIADVYDAAPHRAKSPDPDLGTFAAARSGEHLRALDLGCGTGNQQVANLGAYPGLRLYGADLFAGMLRQAAAKSRDIGWIQCDGARLPFRAASFDYLSNQFSLHHVQDKGGLMREALRVLSSRGRLVLANFSPQGMEESALYRYFGAALEQDRVDFLPDAEHVRMLEEVGFVEVTLERWVQQFERVAAEYLGEVRRRHICSPLMVMGDDAYAAGLRRLEAEIAGGVERIPDRVAIIVVRATRP